MMPKPPPDILDKVDSKSSLFEKVPPDLRRQVNQALIDRDPHTYQGVFDKFNLAAFGVSFTAFYNYGKRIRLHAAWIAALPKPRQIHGPAKNATKNVLAERRLC